jgi:hypothetical protein
MQKADAACLPVTPGSNALHRSAPTSSNPASLAANRSAIARSIAPNNTGMLSWHGQKNKSA